MFNLIKKLYHDFIVWGYIRYGLMYGDELSYSFMGECGNSRRAHYHFFRERYCKLGYLPIALSTWEIAGGYEGFNYIKPLLYIKEKI